MLHTIKDFKKETLQQPFFSKWIIISEGDDFLTLQYIQPAQNASCLIGFILLCFFVIPGILYLLLGGSPQQTRVLKINKIDYSLIASGDEEAVNIANNIINKDKDDDELQIVETTIEK